MINNPRPERASTELSVPEFLDVIVTYRQKFERKRP